MFERKIWVRKIVIRAGSKNNVRIRKFVLILTAPLVTSPSRNFVDLSQKICHVKRKRDGGMTENEQNENRPIFYTLFQIVIFTPRSVLCYI